MLSPRKGPTAPSCEALRERVRQLEDELASVSAERDDARATIRELIAGAAAGMAAGDGLIATLADQVGDLQEECSAMQQEAVETEEDLEFATGVAIEQDSTIENLKIALLRQPPLGRH